MNFINNFANFGDLLIFSFFFMTFFLFAHFRSRNWILRGLFAFIFAYPLAQLILSSSLTDRIANFQINGLYLSLALFFMFLFLFRRLHFDFSYRSLLSKVFLALSASLALVFFLVVNFDLSLFVYDAFSNYSSFINSPEFIILLYASVAVSLVI